MRTKEETIAAVKNRKSFYAVFSGMIPGMPYVINNRESYHDEVRVFADKEEASAWCVKNRETCGKLEARPVEGPGIRTFAATLHNIGVDAVVYSEGGEETELELDEVFILPDFSKLPEEKRPLMNPSLEISAIYFLQELRMEKDPRISKTLPALHEEMIVNLGRSQYYLVGRQAEQDGKQFLVPLVMNFRDKNTGETTNVLPICSDELEFEKFLVISKQFASKELKRFKLPFAAAASFISDKVPRVVVNPAGISLNIDAKLAKLILRRAEAETPQNSKA